MGLQIRRPIHRIPNSTTPASSCTVLGFKTCTTVARISGLLNFWNHLYNLPWSTMSNVQVFFPHKKTHCPWSTTMHLKIGIPKGTNPTPHAPHAPPFRMLKKTRVEKPSPWRREQKPQEALVSTLKLWGFPVGCPLDQLPSRIWGGNWKFMKIHNR